MLDSLTNFEEFGFRTLSFQFYMSVIHEDIIIEYSLSV